MAPGVLFDYVPSSPNLDAKYDSPIFPGQYETSVPGSVQGIPTGWPRYLNSYMAWTKTKYTNPSQFVHVLTKDEKLDIANALQHFKDLALDGEEVTHKTFPLPILGGSLEDAALQLHQRRGFIILRGLNPQDYSEEDNIIVFTGVSSYIAKEKGMQDDEGNLFGHIREAKMMKATQGDRLTMDSKISVNFHTDKFCDIIAMHVRGLAAQGGNHIIASSWNIYNKLAATRPDLVNALAKPQWSFNTRGRLYQAKKRPLLYFHDGRIILNFQANALNDPDFRREELTALQLEALAMIQKIASEDQITLDLQPGDMIYLNNFAILHGREAFEDSEIHSRYIVRMWLKNEELAWKLPRPLEIGNRLIYEEDELLKKVWNVRYTPKLEFDIRDRLDP